MACPVCEDRGGHAGEGKETQHSFKELDLLDGNNSRGKKNKDENNHRLLWHCGRLQFFHHWLLYAHIRTHRGDMESGECRLPFAI